MSLALVLALAAGSNAPPLPEPRRDMAPPHDGNRPHLAPGRPSRTRYRRKRGPSPLASPCPVCHAAPGSRCTGRTGKPRDIHGERR